MIAEAVDTAVTLGWALLAWIVLLAVTVTLALYTLTVAVWAVGRGVWRLTAPLRARAPLPAATVRAWRPRRRSRPLASTRPLPEPPAGVQSVSARPAPAWARTGEEAA